MEIEIDAIPRLFVINLYNLDTNIRQLIRFYNNNNNNNNNNNYNNNNNNNNNYYYYYYYKYYYYYSSLLFHFVIIYNECTCCFISRSFICFPIFLCVKLKIQHMHLSNDNYIFLEILKCIVIRRLKI